MKKIMIYGFTIVAVVFFISNPIDKVSAVTNKTSHQFQVSSENINYNLTNLNIALPTNWHLDTSAKVQYFFVDDKGKIEDG